MQPQIENALLTVTHSSIINAISANMFWFACMVMGVVAIVFVFVTVMVVSSTRERTRREIAAYIAEGSMTQEQGERLIGSKFKDAPKR